MSELLRCSKCGEHKDKSNFHKDNRASSGRTSRCKPCSLADKKKQYKKDRENRLQYRRSYLYGLSEDEYQSMLHKSEGKCNICGDTCSSGKALAVDHCHTTGKIRGLLCGNCNQALGRFKDNIRHLKSAIEYLERSRDV